MHEIIGHVVEAYLGAVDGALPDRVEGLYLVGSVALDDFWPDQSDIDFVAVVAKPLDADELTALAAVHEEVAGRYPRPHLSGVYVTWDHLATDPRTIGPVPQHHEGSFEPEAGFDANVVQWQTLHRHPVSRRGPEAPEVWVDDAATREWVLENLNGYWAEWAGRQRNLVRGIMLMTDWAVTWGVLGVARIHRTLATGEVVSKSAAGAYALDTFGDRWQPIVTEALRLRRGDGDQPESYRRRPLARRRDALDFMSHVIADANERFAA